MSESISSGRSSLETRFGASAPVPPARGGRLPGRSRRAVAGKRHVERSAEGADDARQRVEKIAAALQMIHAAHEQKPPLVTSVSIGAVDGERLQGRRRLRPRGLEAMPREFPLQVRRIGDQRLVLGQQIRGAVPAGETPDHRDRIPPATTSRIVVHQTRPAELARTRYGRRVLERLGAADARAVVGVREQHCGRNLQCSRLDFGIEQPVREDHLWTPLTQAGERAAPARSGRRTTKGSRQAARTGRRRAALRARARRRFRGGVAQARGRRCGDSCPIPPTGRLPSSGWRCARLLCGATERTDGVTHSELPGVKIAASRGQALPRALVQEQSERFSSQGLRLVQSHKRDATALLPQRLREMAGRRDHGHTQREASHGAGPAAADSVRKGLHEHIARSHVLSERAGGEHTGRVHSRGELRMIPNKLPMKAMTVLTEQQDD